MKLSDAIRRNGELKKSMGSSQLLNAIVMSNVTVNHLKDILECRAREEGINLDVTLGTFDTIVQDSTKLTSDKNMKLVFWELANLTAGIHYSANLLDDDGMEALANKVKTEISFVLNNLRQSSVVFFNLFSASPFFLNRDSRNKLALMEHRLNEWLLSQRFPNVSLVDINLVYQNVSIANAIDLRMFRSSKSLHTPKFFDAYVQQILPTIRSLAGKAKKVLVLDCDNTLWGGIVGEDGLNGIQLAEESREGSIFREVQHIVSGLARNGVVIALNSKNNANDVDEVFSKHHGMVLKAEDVVIRQVNWSDKVSNLKSIAAKLNVGIDSLVFIDDSDYEINFVRDKLPQVAAFMVPKNLDDYPQMMRTISCLFYNHSTSDEDQKRVQMYKEEQARQSEMNSYDDLNAYLQSLEIRVTVVNNEPSIVPRIAQLTQKTNQFNLTTKRYTETDIHNFLASENYLVTSMEVSDRFGGYGVTGLAIVRLNGMKARIDSLLMSCRILGRRVETAFLNYLALELRNRGLIELESSYFKTAKNEIVNEFYEAHGFVVRKNQQDHKEYSLMLNDFVPLPTPHIQIQSHTLSSSSRS
jgi:FkbH-like protein